MARQESAAERSLRELQERAGATSYPLAGTTASGREGRRRTPWIVALVGAVVVVVAVVGVMSSGLIAGGGEGGMESGSYEDADFAMSLEEADPAQAARGREAIAAVEALDYPSEWTIDDAQTELTMRQDDNAVSGDYDLYYKVPADYSSSDVSTWFEAEPTVAASDAADAGCEAMDGDIERAMTCKVTLEGGDRSGSATRRDLTRPYVTVTYFAGSDPTVEGSILVGGYSLRLG